MLSEAEYFGKVLLDMGYELVHPGINLCAHDISEKILTSYFQKNDVEHSPTWYVRQACPRCMGKYLRPVYRKNSYANCRLFHKYKGDVTSERLLRNWHVYNRSVLSRQTPHGFLFKTQSPEYIRAYLSHSESVKDLERRYRCPNDDCAELVTLDQWSYHFSGKCRNSCNSSGDCVIFEYNSDEAEEDGGDEGDEGDVDMD